MKYDFLMESLCLLADKCRAQPFSQPKHPPETRRRRDPGLPTKIHNKVKQLKVGTSRNLTGKKSFKVPQVISASPQLYCHSNNSLEILQLTWVEELLSVLSNIKLHPRAYLQLLKANVNIKSVSSTGRTP